MARPSAFQCALMLLSLLLSSQSAYGQNRRKLPARPNKGGQLSWQRDSKAALEEAKVLKKPVLLFFTADW
jgi:hypothetical protein